MMMARRRRGKNPEDSDLTKAPLTGERFTRVIAVIVALENYRKPAVGDPLPSVAYAHADADAFAAVIKEIFKDIPSADLVVEVSRMGMQA
jgi:hypothetical protein